MANLTKHGVCYNLKESPFFFSYRGMVFFFSSRAHMHKFMDNVTSREHWLNDSLSRRFKCTVDLPILADIQLYATVETRGFYIQCDGTEYTSPSQVYVAPDYALIGVEDGD